MQKGGDEILHSFRGRRAAWHASDGDGGDDGEKGRSARPPPSPQKMEMNETRGAAVADGGVNQG